MTRGACFAIVAPARRRGATDRIRAPTEPPDSTSRVAFFVPDENGVADLFTIAPAFGGGPVV